MQTSAADSAAPVAESVAFEGGHSGVLPNSQAVSISGVKAPRNRAMRLGLLPVGDPAAPRTANVITKKDHFFWTLDSGKRMGEFLQESFPQLEISSLFTEQQLEAIAASRGGVFPPPQHLRHFTAVLESNVNNNPGHAAAAQPSPQAVPEAPPRGGSGGDEDGPQKDGTDAARAAAPCSGVVLIGDAIHCFPPDLGQGVNSSMTDALVLAQALDEASGNLARALPLFEARQAPEAAALAEIMTFGFPYQYNQDTFKRNLWMLNTVLRSALHGLFPWAFSPQTFMLIRRAEMSYVQIREAVHTTTQRIWVLAGTLAALAILAIRAMVVAAGAPVS
ncbi:hypothetical protein Vretimale_6134 [Volvox reticuliferus]|nr:hypothetical protein Vretifemale_7958 [Volvox reticuliferus]GIM01325.1 hypothetical protein Vretimale_6134 [Volvox reticuliferus]